MEAADYITQSRERTAPKFARTKELLADWTTAYRLWLAQPSDEFRDLAKRAHAAYKAEQERVLSLSLTTNPV